jgi:hypothetical protein
MAHVPLFWLIAVGLVLAVGLVGGGLARMREQRRHVRALIAVAQVHGDHNVPKQRGAPPPALRAGHGPSG